MNVLLTCAGRRNYLVRYFQEALDGHGQVFAADARWDAPALHEADRAFVVPAINRPEYLDTLLYICEQQHVRLLISLNDLELPVLAKQQARFAAVGTRAIIPSPDIVELCFDKWKTYEFLETCGLKAPRTYLSVHKAQEALARAEITFPLVLKPRWGTASIGIEYAGDEEEMELAYKLIKKRLARTFLAEISATDPEKCILIQEQLQGQEYGLDIVNDLDGNYVCTFAKRKLSMRAGETDRAVTVKHYPLEKLGQVIGQRLGHVGNLDCDVFAEGRELYPLEMNPRFGGGYPFSHVAGANLPAALIAWAERREPERQWLTIEPDVAASKCDRLVTTGKQVSRKGQKG